MECDCGWAGALAAVPNVTAACADYDGIVGAGNDVVGRLGCQNEEKKGEENVATSREAVTNVGGEFRIFVWDIILEGGEGSLSYVTSMPPAASVAALHC